MNGGALRWTPHSRSQHASIGPFPSPLLDPLIMAPSRRFFVLGNWKMNVNASLIGSVSRLLSEAKLDPETGTLHIINSSR